MDALTAINLLFSGMTLGAVYVLMALGLTLVYGITKVFNYAQGSFFTWGGYLTWSLVALIPGLPYGLLIVLSVALMFVAGVVFERGIVRPVRRHKEWDFTVIIVTLGCALALDNLALATYGALSKKLPHLLEGTINVAGVGVSTHDLLMLVIALVVLGALWFFLGHTRPGMAMRAVSQDTTGAKMVGLPVDRLYGYSFGIAAALSGLAAILLVPRTLLYPGVGWTTLLKAFAIIVLGGLGNVKGTIFAAFALAIVEVLASYAFGGIWALPLFLALLVVVLVIKPKGLFGTW